MVYHLLPGDASNANFSTRKKQKILQNCIFRCAYGTFFMTTENYIHRGLPYSEELYSNS